MSGYAVPCHWWGRVKDNRRVNPSDNPQLCSRKLIEPVSLPVEVHPGAGHENSSIAMERSCLYYLCSAQCSGHYWTTLDWLVMAKNGTPDNQPNNDDTTWSWLFIHLYKMRDNSGTCRRAMCPILTIREIVWYQSDTRIGATWCCCLRSH